VPCPGRARPRLRRGRQADFVEPGQTLPVRCGLRRRFHTLGGAAQGKEAGELLVQPAGEVAHRGVDTHKRGLRQPLPLQRFQECLGHRHKPFLGPVMFVEVLVEGQEALQVAAFGIEGGVGMPGGFGHQVDSGEFHQAVFCLLDMRQNVMGWILSQNQ
jgi:hypothetical protein